MRQLGIILTILKWVGPHSYLTTDMTGALLLVGMSLPESGQNILRAVEAQPGVHRDRQPEQEEEEEAC